MLPKNCFFHTLKGINGFSNYNLQTLDIAEIRNISYNKRSFCLFDKKFPFTLRISYSITHFPQEFNSTITKRYCSEKECQDEMDEIYEKQKKLERIKKLSKLIRDMSLKKNLMSKNDSVEYGESRSSIYQF